MSLEIIQIIEDDPAHAGLLDQALRKARYRTNIAHDAQAGLNDIRRLKPALVLLDVMLPGIDGYELCRRLRADETTEHLPIILLTALATEEHRVAGLEFGADDFIPKPFSPREVVSRVRAVLRRSASETKEIKQREQYLNGELKLLESYVLVEFCGKRLDLSRAEWTVLRKLARQVGEVVPQEELAHAVWGKHSFEHEQQLDRLMGGLKWRLNDQGSVNVVSVPSVGYLLKVSSA